MFWKLRLRRHRYRSEIDGVMEHLCVYRPKGYWRLASCPLVILLHGYGGDEHSMIGEQVTTLADRHGMLLLSLRGRGNVFYDRLAEEDFFRALEATCARYRVDRDRLYLLGVSMGGTGVWRLTTRFPHLFAAVVPICGWTDSNLWYHKWYAPATEDTVSTAGPASGVRACTCAVGPGRPPFLDPLLAEASALAAAENMIHVPAFVLHGGRDTVVCARHSRRMVARLRHLGGKAVYKEYARSRHQSFVSRWGRVFAWLDGAGAWDWREGYPRREWPSGVPLRRVTAPRQVSYVTWTLRYRRAYWVEIDALRATHTRARVAAQWHEDGRVFVRVENIRAFTLHPPDEFLTGVIEVRAGGALAYQGPPQQNLSFQKRGSRWVLRAPPETTTKVLRKRPGLEGPIADAFTSRFVLVAGSAAGDRAEAEHFRDFWHAWLLPQNREGRPRGQLPIIAAAAAHCEKDANLILFGCAETNAVIAEHLPRLPLAPLRDGVRCGTEWYPGAGLFMVYPNACQEQTETGSVSQGAGRYLVILSGHFPWRVKDLEALPWLLPDYVVFDPKAPLRRTTHRAWEELDRQLRDGAIHDGDMREDEKPLRYLYDGFLRAGFFNEEWRL